MFEVLLNPGADGPRYALLREPSGHEESLFTRQTRQSPVLASELVSRLLVSVSGTPSNEAPVWSLSISDRDRLVAELYLRCFGDQVDAVTSCSACSKSFSLGFSLTGLLGEQQSQLAASADFAEGPDAAGLYRLKSGARFRLPTAGDERALAGLTRERWARALLERCVVEGELEHAASEVQAAMEAVAPMLSLELPANCPLCGAAQRVEFDLVGFFQSALTREQQLLAREVHYLARAYRWSHTEILGLTRSSRRAFVALILAEHEARTRGLAQ